MSSRVVGANRSMGRIRVANAAREPGSTSGGGAAATWVLGILGFLLLGLSTGELWGALTGALVGLLLANTLSMRTRLRALELQFGRMRLQSSAQEEAAASEQQSKTGEDRAQSVEPTATESRPAAIRPNAPPPSDEAETPAAATASAIEDASPDLTPAAAASPPREPFVPAAPREPAPPSVFSQGLGLVRSFFLGGNTVVRVGLLVLLVGLVLLAKYAADNALFPIEARLAFGALVGLGLVAFGYRQREERPGFGMSLQGGGIAALYLITFFAFKLYVLIPSGLAFGLFVALAVATVMLSLLQKSEPLIVIGSLGGFFAPVLASTGGGSHVALFSYYTLLITAIAAVAWRQSWRIPGLVAFVCTYVVAGAWGVLRYSPADYSSTQPFVIVFMFLFTGIAFLHATRRKCQLRGVVDGTLVFGTAFISILIQAALVRERELGLALSAAGFAVFYMGWALLLWRKSAEVFRPLAEAFLALAVGFATMAIPFAFEEALTTAVAWALEGALLYWVGVRQSRVLPRVAGFALQILGALAFFLSVALDDIDPEQFLPIANGRALSCLALAFAGMFIARQAYAHRSTLRSFETVLAQGLGILGLLWWTGGAIAEIEQFLPDSIQLSAWLVFVAATAFMLELGGSKWDWIPGRLMALVSLPAAALSLVLSADYQQHILADGGYLAWAVIFAALYFLWERLKDVVPSQMLMFRAGCTWLAAIWALLTLGSATEEFLDLSNGWILAASGAGVGGVLFGGLMLDERERSPFDRESRQARLVALGPVVGLAVLTIIWLQFAATGDASPIPHIPVLNPVDLIVVVLAMAIFAWWRVIPQDVFGDWARHSGRVASLGALALAFFCLNGVLVRAVHQWGGVALDADRLWDSGTMQVTLSIAWTVVGLVGMLYSSRRGWREAWMGFAALLGVVVVKLFLVDLSQLGTVERIGTFLAVGAMLLVLGYFSPVPPGGDDREMADTGGQPMSEGIEGDVS